jgi:hypothetical protein
VRGDDSDPRRLLQFVGATRRRDCSVTSAFARMFPSTLTIREFDRTVSGAMIVAQEPAEPRPAMNVTVRTRWGENIRRNQPIVKALVIRFLVVMRHERGERPAQVGFPEDDDAIQAFLLDRRDESLRVRVAVGRPERGLDNANADVGQGLVERRAPFGVPIADQDPVVTGDAIISAGHHTSGCQRANGLAAAAMYPTS